MQDCDAALYKLLIKVQKELHKSTSATTTTKKKEQFINAVYPTGTSNVCDHSNILDKVYDLRIIVEIFLQIKLMPLFGVLFLLI